MKPKKAKKQSPAKPRAQKPGSFPVPKKIKPPVSKPNFNQPANIGWNRFGNIGRQGRN